VDDAIVVVENVERNLRLGLSPREAARKTMDEVHLGFHIMARSNPTSPMRLMSPGDNVGRCFQR
jgi:hypothetical protein